MYEVSTFNRRKQASVRLKYYLDILEAGCNNLTLTKTLVYGGYPILQRFLQVWGFLFVRLSDNEYRRVGMKFEE
jgi:hypothetical protein